MISMYIHFFFGFSIFNSNISEQLSFCILFCSCTISVKSNLLSMLVILLFWFSTYWKGNIIFILDCISHYTDYFSDITNEQKRLEYLHSSIKQINKKKSGKYDFLHKLFHKKKIFSQKSNNQFGVMILLINKYSPYKLCV